MNQDLLPSPDEYGSCCFGRTKIPQIKHKDDICYWHLRPLHERMIATAVLLVPCCLMATYGYLNMDYSSNYILLQIIGWAGIATYILQFLVVEGMELTQRQIYFFRGPLILGLFWHSERVSMEREKEIFFQHKSKQDLGQSRYTIEVKENKIYTRCIGPLRLLSPVENRCAR